MTVSANIWQARAAMCELLALSFRYPEDKVLAEAIASGERSGLSGTGGR